MLPCRLAIGYAMTNAVHGRFVWLPNRLDMIKGASYLSPVVGLRKRISLHRGCL